MASFFWSVFQCTGKPRLPCHSLERISLCGSSFGGSSKRTSHLVASSITSTPCSPSPPHLANLSILERTLRMRGERPGDLVSRPLKTAGPIHFCWGLPLSSTPTAPPHHSCQVPPPNVLPTTASNHALSSHCKAQSCSNVNHGFPFVCMCFRIH